MILRNEIIKMLTKFYFSFRICVAFNILSFFHFIIKRKHQYPNGSKKDSKGICKLGHLVLDNAEGSWGIKPPT